MNKAHLLLFNRQFSSGNPVTLTGQAKQILLTHPAIPQNKLQNKI
jgi:hypothetical protein